MENKIHTTSEELGVVSAVADKKQVVFYLDNGEQLVIKQGDHRLGDLLDIIIPINTRGETAVVRLEDFSVYAAFEKKSTGLTKFFKVAKEKVTGWFGGKTDTHRATLPDDAKKAIIEAVKGETMTEEHVMEHGVPVHADEEVGPDDVIVAVVTTPAVPATETAPAVPESKAVIPGAHNIKPLLAHAVKTKSIVGMQAFLNRCAGIISSRAHTVDDLMRFLEKGDLPIADDGSIIAYKRLKTSGDDGVFLDLHSGRIRQRVGSYVCVNEDLVDLNRRNECSNGLHIARRGYLKSFNGNVTVLCKIDPEDVMVVPHNDPNKVRVKGYHILGVLSDAAIRAIDENLPMTGDNEALKMVYNAIKGNHIDRIERVQVNGQMGSNVVITKLDHDKNKADNAHQYDAEDLKKAKALDDVDGEVLAAVDPRAINKRTEEERERLAGTNPTMAVVDGLDDAPEVELTDADLSGTEPEEEDDDNAEHSCSECGAAVDAEGGICDECQSEQDEDAEETQGLDPAPARVESMEPKTDFPGSHVEDKGWPKADKPPTKAEQMAELLLDFDTSPNGDARKAAAQKMADFKKSAKKSWDVLGVPEHVVKAIEVYTKAQPASEPKKEQPSAMDTGTPHTEALKPGPKEEKTKPETKTKVKSVPAPLLGSKAKPAAPAVVPLSPAKDGKKTHAEHARDLFKANAFRDLQDYKKRVKKGWETLGFTASEIEKITAAK